jgi:hypothetical protein
MLSKENRPLFFLRRYRKPLIWVLLIVGFWQGLPLLVGALFDWSSRPPPLQEVLDQGEVALVAQTLHLKLTDSVTRAYVLANADAPFIAFSARFDVDGTDMSELFNDDWVLSIRTLAKADNRLPSSTYFPDLSPDAIWGDWWDPVPTEAGDQLWQLPVPGGKSCYGVGILRGRSHGFSLYVTTYSLQVDGLPAGLYKKLESQWIHVGIMPGQGGYDGGIWKKPGAQ